MTKVLITGARGNLGWKLIRHFVQLSQITRVTGISRSLPAESQTGELPAQQDHDSIRFAACDLRNVRDENWRQPVSEVDAIVHFAAQNPYPEATWHDAMSSFDMTLNLALAAVDAGVKRFVFASSNHVMGRYKDSPLSDTIGPGELTTSLEPGVGTVWHAGVTPMDSTAYASAKSSAERLCRSLAHRSGGATEFVCTRIGWCQPGDNLPETISSAGTPTKVSEPTGADSLDLEKSDRWFRRMWLSNRDFVQLHAKAVLADSSGWPAACIVVNGMSRNEGMPWSLKEARDWLGYKPEDGIECSN